MLGFKSLVAVASAAVVLFAQASVAATVPELGVSKRGVSGNANAIARRNAVKSALARRREDRVKRQRTAWKAPAAAAAAPVAAPANSAASSDGAFSSVLTGAVTYAVSNVRCRSRFTCAASFPAPANADGLCLNGRCAFSCRSGYAPSADQSSCVAAAGTCGGTTCTQPTNGYTTCSADGTTCVPGCNTGYSPITSTSGAFACSNFDTDASNCGSLGNACPASYNGIGSATCTFGVCRIACPAGSVQRSAASTTNPIYCYSGESSLVQS
ncbi:hypothetical protein JCM10908_007002 [Rhodotorula pacifica]|uniref:uncharacterized protein n=1 Tax=Rhodotorula pacifica TaxID=1495444 RepID=UPI00317DA98A